MGMYKLLKVGGTLFRMESDTLARAVTDDNKNSLFGGLS